MNFSFRLVLEKNCPSAFYAGDQSRTGHVTSTRPDRQPAPVDPTWFQSLYATGITPAVIHLISHACETNIFSRHFHHPSTVSSEAFRGRQPGRGSTGCDVFE